MDNARKIHWRQKELVRIGIEPMTVAWTCAGQTLTVRIATISTKL